MCGHDWCSVRISKEIIEFVSGKDEAYAWELPDGLRALTDEQRAILEQRGVLSPEEIHRLAGKTRRAMGAGRGHRASCHSDVASDAHAHELQAHELDPVTLEPLRPVPESISPRTQTQWAGAKRPSLTPPWLGSNNSLFGLVLPVLEVFLQVRCTFGRMQHGPCESRFFAHLPGRA